MSTGQNRVFYACQAVGMAGNYGAEKYIEGVQSVGINTTFDFEQSFELGVLTIYENIEGVPSVEVTMERNLVSGVQPLWYSIARIGRTKAGLTDSKYPADQVLAVGEARPSVALQVYRENTTLASPSATGTFSVKMSGMYLSNYSINVGVDGPATESLTLTGNDYKWEKATSNSLSVGPTTTTGFTSASGIVWKRQNLNTGVFPQHVPNGHIFGSGLQSISVSIDFGREDIFELGKKNPYYKSPTYPVEVSTDIEFVETNTIAMNNYGPANWTEASTADVTRNVPLGFVIGDIGVFMGSGNRLTGTSTTGGDAGGGNSTVTFNYQTFNELAVACSGTVGAHYNKNNTTGTDLWM
jgi:hypothetical protein